MVSLDVNAIIEPIASFARQSERVLNVTHKPRGPEFQQISYVTAAGMAIIGGIGFLISMVAHALRSI